MLLARLLGDAHLQERALPFAEHDHAFAVFTDVFFDERAAFYCRFRHFTKCIEIELEIEVAAVANDRSIFHHL